MQCGLGRDAARAMSVLRALVVWSCACSAAAGLLTGLAGLLPAAVAGGLERLVRAAADTCEALPLEVLFSREFPSEVPHLEVIAFRRGGARRSYRVHHSRHTDRLLHDLHEHDLHGQPPALYIPGWWNSPTDESTSAIVRALLAKTPVVLVLDTRLSFCRGYVSAASRVRALAHLLYEFIVKLDSRGVPPERVHLIGFSLGAHVAGVAGKLVRSNMKRKLQRITALDPAKPCFSSPAAAAYRLGKRDARFVQALHTSAGVLGLERPVGHADVYMNGVSVAGGQPECRGRTVALGALECDHSLSWRLYARSVSDAGTLMGHKCRSWSELTSGRCDGDATVLGYGCNSTTKGLYLYRSGSGNATQRNARRDVQERPDGILQWLL